MRRSILIAFMMINVWKPCEQAVGNLRPDVIAAEAGHGSGLPNTHLFRIGTAWRWRQPNPAGRLNLKSLWEVSLGRWDGDLALLDVGLSPIFRLTVGREQKQVSPYIEACIGFHYISQTRMHGRHFSTNFQFGDHLAVGFQWGKRFDIAYKFQHLSNGGIKRPNAGINFHILRLSCRI